MAYDNELKGVLFRNDKRESESHPNYKGSITIHGVEYWLSAWINEKKDGSGKYMSLKAQPKESRQQPGNGPAEARQQQRNADPFASGGDSFADIKLDEDIPFN